MATPTSQTLAASAARTTTGNSSAIEVTGANVGLLVNVTASSGTTPTLDVSVQWSADGTTFVAAQAADSFTQITGNTGAAKVFAAKGAFYRVLWTIGGTTPSFTFTVDAITY